MVTQSRLPAFLLTRPMAQSLRFSASLRRRFGQDLDITISPLISPQFYDPPFPTAEIAALLFTSETGVAAFTRLSNLPDALTRRAFCVGARTAKAAAAAGLDAVSADGDAQALIALVQHHAPNGPLLHICGAHTRGDVAQTLTDAGFETLSLVGYEQREAPLSADAISLLRGERAIMVPLFSPRSAALFSNEVSALGPTAPISCAALSAAVGEPLSMLRDIPVCYAKEPNAESLIDAIAGFFAASQTP